MVNIQGIEAGQMKLSGHVLGDIYLGKIKRWNDPAIVALNPGVKLPDADIAPVRRADGSGTSFIFTNYLSKVNDEWKSAVSAQLDRLRGVRVCQAEQDEVRAAVQQHRHLCFA